MKIQNMNGNGNWETSENPNYFINEILERESWYAVRMNREPMTTRQQVLDVLATGKILKYADFWFGDIRDADAFIPVVQKSAKFVKCICGHEVEESQVMSASMGTSCQDCYDRMSDQEEI